MEGKKMKKKGFTLVELLVVIAIIAMLLAILMPALAKVRTLAQRIMCGTNVGGLGKAMLTYSSDDKYESLPIAGPSGTSWNTGTGDDEPYDSWDWNKKATPGSVQNPSTVTPPLGTIGACLYLLVKFADVPPDQFVCPGGEEKKFELMNYDLTVDTTVQNFTDLWNFGSPEDDIPNLSRKRAHNSYSYQLPLPLDSSSGVDRYKKSYPVYATSNPALVIMADRSPWWDKYNYTTMSAETWTDAWDTTGCKVKPDYVTRMNSYNHQRDGQNVLFADQHVKFEKAAQCSVEKDNIYTTWNVPGTGLSTTPCDRAQVKQVGGTENPRHGDQTTVGNCPQDTLDSFLVQDYN